jgi:hypothetical protein
VAVRARAKSLTLATHAWADITSRKKIEVFFAIEGDAIVTATVYVFYGKWEIDDGDSV